MIAILKNVFVLRKVIRFVPKRLYFGKFLTFTGEFWNFKKNTTPNQIFLLSYHRTNYTSGTSLSFVEDEDLYLKFCKKIKDKPNEVLSDQLSLFPLATMKHHKEKYFVDNILPSWFNQLELQLEKVEGNKLVSTIFHLQQINYSCQGDVIKLIKWCRIEKILEYCLLDIKSKNFTSKRLSMLLQALVNFKESSSEIALSEEMLSILSEAFALFFSQEIVKAKVFANNIGDILLYSSKLGFIKNSQEELKNVIPICSNDFHSKDLCKSIKCLTNCHRIGSTFLALNFDLGNDFLCDYFAAIEKTYDRYNFKERFCVNVLKTCLLVGLKFSMNEFEKIKTFWQTEMGVMTQHLRRPEIDVILDLCLKKFDGNLTQIEKILSKNVLDQLLNRTDCFTRTLSYTNVPLSVSDNSNCKFDEKNYFFICDELVSGKPNSLSANVLNQLPDSAVTFKNESKFVTDVALKWWSAFESKLQDIEGYKLVHPLYALSKMNKKLHGELNRQFTQLKEHPAQKLASYALKNIENENFTHVTFSSLLFSIEQLLLKSNDYKVSTSFAAEISSGFKSFFNPILFNRRLFIHECHQKICEILHDGKVFLVPTPSEDILQVIVTCCSQNFKVNFSETDNVNVANHLFDLKIATDTFIEWNVDVDKYYPSFWSLYFNEIQTNYLKLNRNKFHLRLKKLLLKSILLVVLKFNKEKEFEIIKLFWQSEMNILLHRFSNCAINNLLKSAKMYGKLGNLQDIVSQEILDEFKRRIHST